MDARFSANSESDAFKNFSKSICLEGASKGVKRKWSARDGSTDMDAELPLCLWFGNSSSSSDSKASSATAMSSPKETNEESSMDIDLDFCLHLGGEKLPVQNKVSSNKVSMDLQDEVDLELSLSSTPAESDISTAHSSSNFEKIPPTVHGDFYINKASVSSSNVTIPTSSVTYASGIQHRTKKCHFNGCSWAHGDEVCNMFARGNNGLCTSHGALLQDQRVHGGATLGSLAQDTVTTEDMNVDINVSGSSGFTGCGWQPSGIQLESPSGREPSRVSEGRVHGGSLIALLAHNSGESSDQGKFNMMPRKWI